MSFKTPTKNIAIIIAIVSFALGALIYNYSKVIFQEGNPWPEIKAISHLTFGGSDMVKLSGSDNKYLTKSQGGPQAIDVFMNDRGYEYTDQLGSGYFYKSSDKTVVLTRRQYSRFYTIWTLSDSAAETSNDLWKTITSDEDITFKYPKELLAKYVSVVEWPPVIKIETGTYSCQTTPQEISSMSDITSERLVDNRTYCVNIKNEGAAGSVYSSYVYTTTKNGKLVNVSFTLQYPNCNNYDEVQRKACTSEREAFDIDGTVDRIVQSIVAKQEQKTLAEELRECLPKSDTASHEKCNELLKQITDYDSCVNAGFSIMKSNPPQCATPNGRTFVENKK
jgi:hypothetical protein